MTYIPSTRRIVAPVSVRDIQQCAPVYLKRISDDYTIESNDVNILCSAKDGEVVTIDGVQWRVIRSENINPWARYRPIPCANNNVPTMLTPAQRQAEAYGVESPTDMFAADPIQQYIDYANSLSNYDDNYVKLRPWGDTRYRRLTDFAKTDAQGNIAHDDNGNLIGYDHLAQPDSVKVTISTGSPQGTFSLRPLIPESQRTLYIPPGSTNARFEFPNDHRWMDIYYEYVNGTSTRTVSLEWHEEWLSPMDFMGDTYGISYASVLRRVLVFRLKDALGHFEGDQYFDETTAEWDFYNYVTDKVGGNNNERPFSEYPLAWLDLTDTASKENTYYHLDNTNPMGTVQGHLLFIDCWLQSDSSTNVLPIPGFAYEVFISRTTDVNVDVSGVLSFISVEVTTETDSGTEYYIPILFIDYDPMKIDLDAGLSEAGETIVPILREYYDSLSLTIGDTTTNLLDTSLEYGTDNSGEGDWCRIYCALPRLATPVTETEATVTAIRKGTNITSIKTISIS